VELNLPAVCEAIEAEVPDRECLVFRDRRLTWGEVGARTRRFANLLAGAGLGGRDREDAAGWESTQDHVALLLHNGNEYLECMLGAMKARCAAVNLNYRYGPAELRHVLDDSGSRAIVYHGCFGNTLAATLGDRRPELLLRVEDGSQVDPVPGSLPYEDALTGASAVIPERLRTSWSPDDLYLCYTGGTTGLPKGVLWRQADFLVAALGVRRRDGSDFGSIDEIVETAVSGGALRALPAPPLMHGAAHWNAISAWTSGGTVVIQSDPTRLDPADIWRTVERERVTSLLVVGDPFARPLLDEWDRAAAEVKPYDASSLRHLLSGGAVLSPATKRALLDRLPGVAIVDVLGSTESGRQGLSRTRDAADAHVGFDSGPTSVVLDERREQVLRPGTDEVGWLAQAGRAPLGYLGDPAKTQATFPEIGGRRYAVAGDRARLDQHGRIVLLGRDSVTINTGGEKVFAEEVETALKEHPRVHDVVVCGRPSERWGEEIVAIVSLRPDAGRSDPHPVLQVQRDHLPARQAALKAPKAVVVVDHVVRSPSGKADYRWARQVAAKASTDVHS
jgi:fatty-acyl-CoA synthase